MSAENNSYSVVLASENDLQIPAIAQALATFKKIPQADAAHEAKNCWGILGENLSPEAADQLIAAAAGARINAIRLPYATVPALPTPVVLNHVVLSETGCTGIDDRGTHYDVRAEKITVIGTAGIKFSETKITQEKQGPTAPQQLLSAGIMMATGLPIRIGPKKQTIEKKASVSELLLFLALVCTDPKQFFVMAADQFNFTALKERMLYNAMGNFKIVIADFLKAAPTARQSRGTRILQQNQPLVTMGYESLANLERECRWLNTL